MLFLRLAGWLNDNGYKAVIVDYIDGDMAKNREPSLSLISYSDDEPVLIPQNSILVLQSMTPWSIYPMLKIDDSSQVFFITTLPGNFYAVLPGVLRNVMNEAGLVAKLFWATILKNEYLKSKRFLKLLVKKNGVAFLDSNIVCNLEKGLKLNLPSPNYIPLFSQDVGVNEYENTNRKNTKLIKLGWVGRLSDFKISILNKVIEDASNFAYKKRHKIEFVVVGSGEYEVSLIDECPSEFFSLIKVPYVKPDELNTFMIDLDMLFAMGTSALEGAKLGIPTIRLDYSYSKIPEDYLYKFFYEIKGHSLGDRLKGSCFQNGNHTFDSVMSELLNNRIRLSKMCYQWYSDNHSITNSAFLFLSYLEKNYLVWKDLKDNKLLFSFAYDMMKKIRKLVF